jgi:menaquinone-dependent protoporphyrinogen oxidase
VPRGTGKPARSLTTPQDVSPRGGVPVNPCDLASAFPVEAALREAQVIVVVAPLRFGRHLAEAKRFFALYRTCMTRAPLIFVSVSLSARKPVRTRYPRKTTSHHGLRPALADAVAGRLDYPRHKWLDLQIIRSIMMLTGGPTDPQCRVAYTSWAAVDVIAGRIAPSVAMHRTGAATGDLVITSAKRNRRQGLPYRRD